MELGEWRGRENLGVVGKEVSMIRIYCMKNIFIKNNINNSYLRLASKY